MPDLIVIRVVPVAPISGSDFTSYLTGLVITAEDIAYARSAIGDISFSAQPAAGSSITLNGTAWTFVTGTPSGNQTQIGAANLDATLTALAADLNASADIEMAKCIYTANTTADRLEIRFQTAGTGGNAFTLAASAAPASNATPSAATLTGGTGQPQEPSGVQRRPLGRARYLPNDVPNSRIFQHLRLIPPPQPPAPPRTIEWHSVATGIIEVPPGLSEYGYGTTDPNVRFATDLVLRIERTSGEIVDRRLHYNVPVISRASLPNPDEYDDLEPAGVFIVLPRPELGLDPNAARVDLPADGSPPNFAALRTAVERVLAADPGGSLDLAHLTAEQSLHIAREIAWNRRADPFPAPPPPRSLDDMYTTELLPGGERDRIRVDADRRTFEADLVRYYASHNGDAERLSKFIFSLSAAIACEQMSDAQSRVGFRLPVRPTAPAVAGQIAETEVTLTSP